ncbi:hypothetical protein MHZ95_08090 [Sporosarcina sp. ACRSM]|uniref:hypothetical protein n=1 Tax=Sporosarcina sp. ACRSM TaxID=2918216 RepID=UPI001EF7097F|nr:hypothetical protein [Sporosarcina sp. ACRSM]MCG7335236.1 hypothetical protein [Sporosarcina sp. ACRSM]
MAAGRAIVTELDRRGRKSRVAIKPGKSAIKHLLSATKRVMRAIKTSANAIKFIAKD